MDDPLSAVDTRVGKHLYEKCIKSIYIYFNTVTIVSNLIILKCIDYLKEKACILVTHQIQYLIDVDQIVLMENVSIIKSDYM